MKPFIFYAIPYLSVLTNLYNNLFDRPKPLNVNITLCDQENDMLHVDGIRIVPDSPIKGQNLSLFITGNLDNEILSDAFLLVQMQKGRLNFPTLRAPVCDFLTNHCPIEKGEVELEMRFEIPSVLPKGIYKIETELYNPDKVTAEMKVSSVYNNNTPITWFYSGERVTCFQGTVEFS